MLRSLKVVFIIAVMTVFANAKELSPFLQAEYEGSDAIEKKLQDGGFEIVAKYKALPQSTTIIFTDEALKKEGTKDGRAFIAVLKVFVDDKEKRVTISNPVYYGKAFMQKEYNDAVFQGENQKLQKAFGALKPSKDKLDEDDIAGYHFMMGMPYYEDQNEIAEGKNDALVKKVQGSSKALFILPLSAKTTLIGFDLSDTTEAFADKIGRANAALLPWTIKIEDDKATIMHPKYYIAISYPTLSMGSFMTISSVPGEIEDEIEAAFK